MAEQRALDKATKEYYARKGKLELPGYIIAGISAVTLITGIWFGIKAIITIGILSLSLGIYFIILAWTAHKTILRK